MVGSSSTSDLSSHRTADQGVASRRRSSSRLAASGSCTPTTSTSGFPSMTWRTPSAWPCLVPYWAILMRSTPLLMAALPGGLYADRHTLYNVPILPGTP